jgi:acyl transferase domain-containing protein/acyl carrier protein
MKSPSSNIDSRSALAAALQELRQRRAEIEALRNERISPIAVIGMACRFPGGCDTPEQFWQLLDQKQNAITEVPPERWQVAEYYDADAAVPGKMATRYGGFLRQVDSFDADFFSISPRECRSLDPQQQLLLEVAWEALENANLTLEQVYGSATGAYVGITCFDHAIRLGNSPENFGAYAGTGSALNMAAGRLSYFLGLTGPSMAIDTACSASLVSLHLACESLRARETNLALAGGVNLMLSPEVMVSFSQARMLAADGRSKTFDAAADGYVRGEGCGVVVLKRLSDAVADGDTILGVVRGSAVNQSGPSGGLTVPSGAAQQRVIERALLQAGVAPHEVDYVEAHGTGTSLGDPIEIEAMAQAYAPGRAAGNPLLTGSVKTNIGHLEPASGIAGLIKVLLSFRHETIPAHLHFTQPNPHIPWNDIPVRVTAASIPWPVTSRKRIAGLSAFGFSGTNAHAIIEEPPVTQVRDVGSRRTYQLLTLSAKSEPGLKELAARYESLLARQPKIDLASLCRGAGAGRSHFLFRLAVRARSTSELRDRLSSFVSTGMAPLLQVEKAKTTQQKKIGFLFTGQGSQSVGMTRELYETEPSFRANLDHMAQLLEGQLEAPLLDVIFGRTSDAGLLDQTAYTQPALFAIEYALAELWKSWGVKPFAVMGHSAGEYVAACQAGVMGLDEGLRLVAARARLMQQLDRSGAMFTVFASRQIVRDAIKPYGEELAIAAINGPAHTVTSGRREAVEAVGKQLAEQGIRIKQLRVSHAFHSPLMKPMLDEFRSLVRQMRFAKPTTKIVSNLTGRLVGEEMMDPEYWIRHLLEPVDFAGGIASLGALNLDAFLEVGPEPVLTVMGRECLGDAAHRWLFSIRAKQNNWDTMLAALAALYTSGATIDWAAFYNYQSAAATELPNYPFQRQRYWHDRTRSPEAPVHTPAESQTELISRLEQSGKLSAEALRLAPEVLQAVADLNRPDAEVDDLLYRVAWEEKAVPLQPMKVAGDLDGNNGWLIFADRGGVGKTLSDLLTQKGERCALAYEGVEYGISPDGVWQLRPDSTDDFNRLMRDASLSGSIGRVLFLWGLDAPAADELTSTQLQVCQKSGCGAVLHIIQSAAGRPRIWLVTRGAVSVQGGQNDRADGLAQSPLWGFGKGILLEQPERLGGCIDLDSAKPAGETEMLLAEIVAGDREDQIAFRDGRRWVPRLTKIASSTPASADARAQISPEGAYLITGGCGALGLHVAKWLVAEGARHLVLVSRTSATNSQAQTVIAGLRSSGVEIQVEQADVADEASINGLFRKLRVDRIRLRGIVHAAGMPGYCALEKLEGAELEAVLRPKVSGAWLLHRLSLDERLDFFVMFSSVASVWGSRSQAHYSAANRFMDILATHRRAIGLPALSINWGPWAEGGMTSAEADILLRRIGVRALKPRIALKTLAQMLASGAPNTAVADVDWSLFRGSYEAHGSQPFLDHISQGRSSQPRAAPAGTFVEQLRAALPNDRKRRLLRFIQAEVAEVLGLGTQHPDTEQGFFEMGMDSLLTVEFKARLESAFAASLPATLIFDHPTIEALAGFLINEISDQAADEQPKIRFAQPEVARSLAAQIEQLSDEEAEALLLQKLETMS